MNRPANEQAALTPIWVAATPVTFSPTPDEQRWAEERRLAEEQRLAAEAAAEEAKRKAEEAERIRQEEERKQLMFEQAIRPRRYDASVSDESSFDVGIREGDYVEIMASGTIRLGAFVGESDPDGIDVPGSNYLSSANHGALLGKVSGCGNWKVIGTEGSFRAGCSGTLHLLVNDSKTNDNRGSYSVRITIRPSEERIRREIWQ
jgi:hypothetical protein